MLSQFCVARKAAAEYLPHNKEDFLGSLTTHVEQVAWLLAFHYESELCVKLGAHRPNKRACAGLKQALQDLSSLHAQVGTLRVEVDHKFDAPDAEPSESDEFGAVPCELTSDLDGYLNIQQIDIDPKYPEKPIFQQEERDVNLDLLEESSGSCQLSLFNASSQSHVARNSVEKSLSFPPNEALLNGGGEDLSSKGTLLRRTRTTTTSKPIAAFAIHPIWVDSAETVFRSDSFLNGRVSTSSCQAFNITESEMILSTMSPSVVTILPGSHKRSMWDILTLFLIMYDCIATPLELLGLPENAFQEVMGWIIRIFWTCDICVSFLTGFIRSDGLTEVRFTAIGKRYAKTWLAADVALVLSDWSEVLIEALNSEASIARMAKTSRVVRTFRTLRFVKMQKAMNFLKLRVESELIVLVLDILRALIVMFGFVHVATCVWCGFGTWTSEWGELTWLYAARLENIPAGDRYMEGFMWALGQFSGGVDFVRPQNSDERVFSVVALIAGFILDAAFISGITSQATKLMLLAGGPSRQLARLKRYLSQHNVSQILTVRLQRNAKHHMAVLDKKLREEQVEALKFISEPLMQELVLEIHSPHLIVHSLFQSYAKLCPAGMRQLCFSAVCVKFVSGGDALFHRLENPVTPKMYFLTDGAMVYAQRRDETTEFEPGQWAAEAVLWTLWTHCGTMSGVSPSQVLELDAKAAQTIIKTSENAVNVEEYALNFVKQLNNTPTHELTDIGTPQFVSERNYPD